MVILRVFSSRKWSLEQALFVWMIQAISRAARDIRGIDLPIDRASRKAGLFGVWLPSLPPASSSCLPSTRHLRGTRTRADPGIMRYPDVARRPSAESAP